MATKATNSHHTAGHPPKAPLRVITDQMIKHINNTPASLDKETTQEVHRRHQALPM
jgi:hypothetical protein